VELILRETRIVMKATIMHLEVRVGLGTRVVTYVTNTPSHDQTRRNNSLPWQKATIPSTKIAPSSARHALSPANLTSKLPAPPANKSDRRAPICLKHSTAGGPTADVFESFPSDQQI